MTNQLKDDPRYRNHESRPDLAGEHPLGDKLQILVFIQFVIAVLVDHFYLGWAARLRNLVPFEVWLPVSLGLILLGGSLSFFGMHSVFSEYTEEPRMVASGLFSYVRHPVYLGALMVYSGLLVFILSPMALLIFIATILLYDWLAQDEEARMLKVFGTRYEEYMRQTPRWLPGLFKHH
ncbi:MAG: isoprenylcysteine carboxylmethyltransferase family protein [Pelolinea sp.]|nr:isoprenylcysteine carboxylmethyltransferase family protein [Pelolinea sp.]